MRLTTRNVRSLTLPDGLSEKTFFDDDLPCFGVRLRASGSRNWIVQYKFGHAHRRMVLGGVTALDASKARETAKDILAAVRLGEDPVGKRLAARDRTAETFAALLPRYLAHKQSKMKPRSYMECERHLKRHCKPLHTRVVSEIDRRADAALLGDIAQTNGPGAANRTRADLSAYFTWIQREGLIENNPVLNTNKAGENKPRTRLLSDDELQEIWQALGEDQYSAIVQLLLLTGARREEIAGLRWSEIDFAKGWITLLPERTKNKRPHEIAITPAIATILKAQPRRIEGKQTRDLVFGYQPDHGWQDWSGSKSDLDARIFAARREIDVNARPMPNWWLHDFRRAMSTAMHETLGIMPHIVEAVLGHVDGHRAGVAGVYNLAAYRAEKANAWLRWQEHLLAITQERAPVVLALRSA